VLEDDPYAVFKREEMILRDWLALDRTILANKRTFLAYARTSIALVVLGMAFIRFANHHLLEIAGFVLIALGVVIFFVGSREYISNGNRLRQLLKKEKELERELVGKELCSEKEA
jgi:putative membrane protein